MGEDERENWNICAEILGIFFIKEEAEKDSNSVYNKMQIEQICKNWELG